MGELSNYHISSNFIKSFSKEGSAIVSKLLGIWQPQNKSYEIDEHNSLCRMDKKLKGYIKYKDNDDDVDDDYNDNNNFSL